MILMLGLPELLIQLIILAGLVVPATILAGLIYFGLHVLNANRDHSGSSRSSSG